MRTKEKILLVCAPNPFRQELEQKVRIIEGFQTERTTKELYETIQNMFRHIKELPKIPFFFPERRSFLMFGDREDEVFGSIVNRYGERLTHYEKGEDENFPGEKSITIETFCAYRIPALDKRVIKKELHPLEEMPIRVTINNIDYNINY